MESALSPREIQTRIRSGESVDDVARVAGIERDRVERFAAPVIAEREHVAGLAMTSSARRRGETSSHRTLRGALSDRLLGRAIDIDTVQWDSYRLDDGRWAITADYLSGATPHQALFYFDLPGRYSVAGNDEGRWVLGDSSPSRGPQAAGRPTVVGETDADTEPTLDLSDELALVRAIQDIPVPSGSGSEAAYEVEVAEVELTIAEVFHLSPAQPAPADDAAVDEADLREEAALADEAVEDEGGLDALYEIFEDQDTLNQTEAEPGVQAVDLEEAADLDAGDFDAGDLESGEPTVALSRSGSAVEGSRPSDASAVPELSAPLQPDAWEPAIVVDYPVEPSEEEDSDVDGVEVPEGSDTPGRPEAPVGCDDRRDEATALEVGDGAPSSEATSSEATSGEATSGEGEQPLPIDVPEQPTPPPAPKPARRKRASVPSWDEIVFGGPKEK